MLGTGVRIVSTEKNHTQGSLVNTKNALDLAVQGEGFFQIAQADGTVAYTRDGSFKLSSTGQLVTANGAALQPAITIPPNVASISIGQDGTVSVEAAGGGGAQVLGQIQLARFANPAGLQSMGQNLMKETTASGAPVVGQAGQAGAGQLMQGALEASNVNVVEEMVNMIETQRAYEINSKAISAVDGMLRFLNNNM
jgi:flagellar basal-body rod protein FlgG